MPPGSTAYGSNAPTRLSTSASPSPRVRGEVANSVQVLLNRPQGVLKGRKRPGRDLRHQDVCALVRLDDEPRPARLRDAPQGTAKQVGEGPGSPAVCCSRDGDVHVEPQSPL